MKYLSAIVVCLLLFSLAGCAEPLTPNNVHEKPHFEGIVVEKLDGSVLVSVNSNEDIYPNVELISVPTEAELGINNVRLNVGDEIIVFYEEPISASIPAFLAAVYMINEGGTCLCDKCRNKPEVEREELQYDQFGNPTVTALTFQEAQENISFGHMFPSEIIDGYMYEYEIGVCGNAVLDARFYNSNGDELFIKIAPRGHFGDVETDTVFYLDNLTNGSYIYFYGNGCIAYYSLSAGDINNTQGFMEMVNSAPAFR